MKRMGERLLPTALSLTMAISMAAPLTSIGVYAAESEPEMTAETVETDETAEAAVTEEVPAEDTAIGDVEDVVETVDINEEVADSTMTTTEDIVEVVVSEEETPAMLSSTNALDATGDGTKSNPWQISDMATLNAFAAKAEDENFNYSDCYVELTKDIAVPSGSVWYGVRDFNGTFDGNGHTISGLTIWSTEKDIGFIREVSDSATISNLNLTNVTLELRNSTTTPVYSNRNVGILVGTSAAITVSGCNISGTIKYYNNSSYNVNYVGGYIGQVGAITNKTRCTINNSTFNGTIDLGKDQYTGGFIGYIGTIGCYMDSCVSTGSITASGNAGGFIGYMSSGSSSWSDGFKLNRCRNEANITSSSGTGGLIGYLAIDSAEDRGIVQCSNIGTISGSIAGGLVGNTSSGLNITECVNEGAVTSTLQYAGGLIGYLYDSNTRITVIQNSYNTGAVSSTSKWTKYLGMIVGETAINKHLQITNCYSNPSNMSDSYGVIGYADNYNEVTLSNVYSPNGTACVKIRDESKTTFTQTNVKALNTTAMKQKSSFIGFDFGSVWKMGKNGPFLAWENKKEVSDSEYTGWKTENGVEYWYENGVKQGTTGRGKEIYDPDSDAWYWLDAVDGGKKAVSKDVYQDSSGGKWVRYDADGHMVKGWQTTSAGTYYFDPITGAMAKGKVTIDGVPCWFADDTGVGKNLTWEQVKGQDYYWYENGKRQGYDPGDKSYRGKEIYDPTQNAWFWLDNNAQGKKAVSKDVYQPYTYQGKDTIGKWVRYDAAGRMIKGWQTTGKGTYYFDKNTGAMLKGWNTIDGKRYYFDTQTGIRK